MNPRGFRAAIAAVVLAASPALAVGPICAAPALGQKEVVGIIAKERATRTDLPAAYAKSTWVARCPWERAGGGGRGPRGTPGISVVALWPTLG